MRWLFLFVLSLNLAYVAWEMSKAPSDNYADVAALKNVGTIVLLSELKQQQAPMTEPGRQDAEDGIELSVSDIKTAEAAAGSLAEPGLSGTPQVAVTDDIAEADPEALSVPASQTLPDSAVQTAAATDVSKAAGFETVSTKAAPATACYTLGPFRDLDELRGLTREIRSYVVKAEFRGQEEKEPTLYWVYVAPEKNRKNAIETGNRLKANRIKDFYVIRDGEKENGLSLGHFRDKNRAYALAEKVTALDFDVNVEAVLKTYTVYWLDYQLSAGAVIPESIIREYTGKGGKGKISRLDRECGVL